MSIDSQRLDIEHVRRLLVDWMGRQPDLHERLASTADEDYGTVLRRHGLSTTEWLGRLEREPALSQLRHLTIELAFAREHRGGSLYERFMADVGHAESGLRRRYLRRLAHSALTVWRITRLGPGAKLDIAPYDGGSVVTVHHRELVGALHASDSLLARVIDMPAGAVLGEGFMRLRGPADAADDRPVSVRWVVAACVADVLARQEESPRHAGDAPPHPDRSRDTERSGSADRPNGADRADDTDRVRGADTAGDAHEASSTRDRERLLGRVRKLFAMAQEGEASPHEAEIALRRCNSLMARYGITETDLETSAFANAELNTGRTVPMHVKFLASAVSRLHDVLFVTGAGGFAEFRGYEVDANVARLTLQYLSDEVERALKARKRAGSFPAGRSAAYDYRVGFAIEVDRRVIALVAERNRDQQQAAGSTGTALAIRKREIVERECGQDLRSSSFRERGARDATARAAGHDDGSRVSLDRQMGSEASAVALPSS